MQLSESTGSPIKPGPSKTWKALEASLSYVLQYKSSTGRLDRWLLFILPAVLGRKKQLYLGVSEIIFTCVNHYLFICSQVLGSLKETRETSMYFFLMELSEVPTVERKLDWEKVQVLELKGTMDMNSAQKNPWHLIINIKSSSLGKLDLLKIIK